ncbi:MAG: hypothetical protein ABIK89_17110 [Planctomycetota bacterium]
MPASFAPIYARLAELGEPYALPKAWSSVKVDPNCRQLADAAAAFRSLEEAFSAEDLETSGVAQQVDGQLVPSPRLAAGEAGFVVLRNDEGEPFDVATAQGCLYGGPPPLRMHLDRTTKEALKAAGGPSKCGVMYGCFSMADTVLVRSLGLAAVPAAGLDPLSLVGLQRLLWLVGGRATRDVAKVQVRLCRDEPGDPATDTAVKPQNAPPAFFLLLVAGSLARLTADVPEALAPVARGLTAATVHLGFEWQGISVWHPTADELATIDYRRKILAAKAVRRFVLNRQTAFPLKAFLEPGPPKVQTPAKPSLARMYLDQLDRLNRDPRDPGADPEEDRRRYEELVDRLFVRPLLDRALETKDLDDRALSTHAAMLARVYHQIAPQLFASEPQLLGWTVPVDRSPPAPVGQAG